MGLMAASFQISWECSDPYQSLPKIHSLYFLGHTPGPLILRVLAGSQKRLPLLSVCTDFPTPLRSPGNPEGLFEGCLVSF